MGVLDFFGREAGQRRTKALNDLARSAEYFIPPELRPIVGLLADITPSETVNRASQASGRMFDADRTAMQRVGDFGTMASEIAGVVAPAAVAGRAGLPAAQALQESLLGFSASPQAVAARNFAADEAGAVGRNSIDDQVAAARRAVLDSPNDPVLFDEYKRLRRMRDEGVSTFSQSEMPAPQVNAGLLGDYAGQHRAPMRDSGAPAFNLAGDIYPDDIYSSRAAQYYGTGSEVMDRKTVGLLQSLRGKPDADVTIYRAVPKGVDKMNAGDWVTVNKQYAKDHGESALGGDFDIIEKKVKAKDIFTNGDSIHEFGYDPSTTAANASRSAGLLGVAFDVTRKDASNIFGEGTERVRYTDPASGGTMEVVVRPDGTASVLELEVPEAARGKGVGQSLQDRVMQDFPKMGGQVSSKAAAKTAYRLGRRPYGQPDATLEDVFAAIDDMSSVNLVSPQMQPQGLLQ